MNVGVVGNSLFFAELFGLFNVQRELHGRVRKKSRTAEEHARKTLRSVIISLRERQHTYRGEGDVTITGYYVFSLWDLAERRNQRSHNLQKFLIILNRPGRRLAPG
jgi:hypothetical protein